MLDRRLLVAGVLLGVSAPAIALQADGRPLRIIVPFAAGGSTDLVARLLGEHLAIALRRPVMIENRPGAGVVLGTHAVARAEPDGTTVLFTTVSHAINPTLLARLPYDSSADFMPVGRVATVPLVLSVNPAVPAKDLKELLAFIRANPGKVSYGSAGIGSILHMAGELFKHQAGLAVVHVPYRGAGPAMNDLLANQIQFIIDPVSTSAPQAAAGNIRALAVTSARRSSQLPDIPTFGEAGMPDYEAATWNVILAPKGSEPDFVARLNQAINTALADPALNRRFEELGVVADQDSTPSSTADFIARETGRWGAIIQAAGIRLEN